jgi:tetratricopeptide (TPR) repeat protein
MIVSRITYYDQKYAKDPKRWVGDLYSVLNRTDIFADFTTESSVGLQWGGPKENDSIGFWNFLWQIIITKELTRRFDSSGSSYAGFTERILASMIISDLWLTNVGIVLTDAKLNTADVEKAETVAEKEKAEDFKNKGNAALQKKQYQEAVDLYTEAIKIDLGNAIYRCNRSAASFSSDKFEDAEEDAYVATLLDPKYAKAWSRLGAARLKLGNIKRAKEAYQRALAVAGKNATDQMRQGLKDSQEKLAEAAKEIKNETNRERQHELRSKYLDQDWEIVGKKVELHSSVHERQVEGLLFFAEKIKWPFINEVRDFAEDLYTNLRGGEEISVHLHDWLYGIILPGKWFAFKIMTVLILCTGSVRDIGVAYYFECGLSLPKRSYWRSRTVLGRVLGSLPGVISLCGWIGPCPPVEFEGPTSTSPPLENKKAKHIRIRTRRLAPHEHKPDNGDGPIIYGDDYHDKYEATQIRPGEEMEPYLADIMDSSRWIIPEPPVRQVSTCELLSIKLKKLPLEVAAQLQSGKSDAETEREVENETQYRASLVFKLDSSPEPVTFKLFTNPVFVMLPPCRPGPRGQHEVHMRELPRYQTNIWTVEMLKDHTAEDSEGDEEGIMTINATGKGGELFAKAWCSERGKNAVVRRQGGPCYVCAVRAVGRKSLGTGVLIWVE